MKMDGTRPFFYPLHLQPIINKKYNFKKNEFKNSEYLSKNGFYIPSGMKLKKKSIRFSYFRNEKRFLIESIYINKIPSINSNIFVIVFASISFRKLCSTF